MSSCCVCSTNHRHLKSDVWPQGTIPSTATVFFKSYLYHPCILCLQGEHLEPLQKTKCENFFSYARSPCCVCSANSWHLKSDVWPQGEIPSTATVFRTVICMILVFFAWLENIWNYNKKQISDKLAAKRVDLRPVTIRGHTRTVHPALYNRALFYNVTISKKLFFHRKYLSF